MHTDYTTVQPGKQWQKEYESFSNRDIFYHPDYYKCNASYAGWDAELFVFSMEGVRIIYPYVLKPLRQLEFLPESHHFASYFDMSTLEYGGPLVDGRITPAALKEFHAAFSSFCVERGIISEFARLHPFCDNGTTYNDARSTKSVFFIDLTKPAKEIEADFKKANRNAITKARRKRVEVRQSRRADDLIEFTRIYQQSMQRKGAEKFYFYSESYIKNIMRELDSKVKLYLAIQDDVVIGGSLFLYDNKTTHYYLSCFLPEYKSSCPTNLVLSEAITDAKKDGYQMFNLGGGYIHGDGLERFKTNFTRTWKPFYTYRKVHGPHIYRFLAQLKEEHTATMQKAYNDTYFPSYRG